MAADVYVYVGIGQNTKMKTQKQSLLGLREDIYIYPHGVCPELTFAGLDALKPLVISVSVPGTSTILIPSTARSATTGSAGFPERSAL